MPTWFRNLALGAASRVPTLLTLTALGALALWGRDSDWRLSPPQLGDQQAEEQAPAGPAVTVLAGSPGSGPGRIEFPSAGAVDKVGIRVAPVRVRALTHSVTAPGRVDYDPGRYARLTARASGSVVRVD